MQSHTVYSQFMSLNLNNKGLTPDVMAKVYGEGAAGPTGSWSAPCRSWSAGYDHEQSVAKPARNSPLHVPSWIR
jgi:hypothetical protein